VCADTDGDGDRECTRPGPCTSRTDCAAREVCGLPPIELVGMCGSFGPCRDAADCPVGFECIDSWGDGVRECVQAGGTCDAASDCPAGQVCGVPASGMRLECGTTTMRMEGA
jgi:hypothetical protein